MEKKKGFRKISWERYEYANQWFQAGKKHWLVNIKRRNQQTDWSLSGKKRARSTLNPISRNVSVETKIEALITDQNEMKQKIHSLKQSIDYMEGQLTSLEFEVPKFPESDEKTRIAAFLKGFMEEFLKRKNDEENSAENADKMLSDVPKSPVQDEKDAETTEDHNSWIEMLVEDEAVFNSNGDLADLHSKAMFQFDEMIASDLVIQPEVTVADLEADDNNNGHLQLWM